MSRSNSFAVLLFSLAVRMVSLPLLGLAATLDPGPRRLSLIDLSVVLACASLALLACHGRLVAQRAVAPTES